jgi:site-specific DNA-methyltransferase (adenine-specific)
VLGDIPDYQKYFYCAKVSRRERHVGFEQAQIPDPLKNYSTGDVKNHPLWDASMGTNLQRLKHKILEHEKSLGRQHTVTGAVGNNHPTVKPVALMRYLIQLVTPANSIVLDPFMGSGSTGMAAVELGHRFVGIDLDANYVAIADKRILGWCAKSDANSTFDKLFD